MDMSKVIAETDMLCFLDDAFCEVGAFGFEIRSGEEEKKALEEVFNYLDIINFEDSEIEPLVMEVARAAEKDGFKRGFNLALRLVIEGLNAGRGK